MLDKKLTEKVIRDFIADLWIEERLIVELKAIRVLNKRHEAQLVSYLNATQMDEGLLINFGPSVQIKRKYRLYRPPKNAAGSRTNNPVNPVNPVKKEKNNDS